MPRGKAANVRRMNKRPRKETPLQANSESAVSEESFEILNSPANSESIKNGTNDEMEDSSYSQDFTGEMSKLLERFSTDMNKTMQAKRKKLEQFTQVIN